MAACMAGRTMHHRSETPTFLCVPSLKHVKNTDHSCDHCHCKAALGSHCRAILLTAKGALAVLTKLVWENMKTRCATSRQRLLSRLTTVERAWRPLVSQVQTKDITVLTRWSGDSAELRLTAAW
jgi:hypothetical protein